jgi:hypothetical protein
VPFEFLGGAARSAFNRRNWERSYPGLDYLKLRNKDAVVDAMEIADRMIITRMRGAHSYEWPPRRIFISRARPDAEFAEALSGYLSGIGLRVLLEREFPTNRTVEAAIEDAVLQSIDGSDVVPRGARTLPQAVARTPHTLVEVIKDLLRPRMESGPA